METLELEEEELDASFGLAAGLYPPRPRGSCTRVSPPPCAPHPKCPQWGPAVLGLGPGALPHGPPSSPILFLTPLGPQPHFCSGGGGPQPSAPSPRPQLGASPPPVSPRRAPAC